jgi:diguanylate cyclase (GGDEF)-like protein
MSEIVHGSFQRHSQWVLSIALPLALIAVILTADVVEGPKTAYVGVLSAIPLLSAVFGKPKSTAFVSIVTWISAFAFGHFASDGNVRAQTVRLVIIAIFGVIAVIASVVRIQRETQLSSAMAQAAQAEAMRLQANSDPLTGLLNRRGVLNRLEQRESTHSTVAVIDVDRFKAINDRYGHLVGDEVIQAIGARIAGGLSRADIVGRWGGDEFVVVLDLECEQGTRVIERVFDQVCSEPLSTSVGDIPVGISVGISGWEQSQTLDSVLAQADTALYSAKDSGRNRFVVAAPV